VKVKILFDQGTPLPLRAALSDRHVAMLYEMGWAELANGELLDTAEARQFEVLMTTDKKFALPAESLRLAARHSRPSFASWSRL